MNQLINNRALVILCCLLAVSFVASCSNDDDGTAAVTIGPEGGVIISSDGRVTLTIPPGALNSAQTIIIGERKLAVTREIAEDSLITITYPLEPNGLQFLSPATISYVNSSDTSADITSSEMILLSNSDRSTDTLLPDLSVNINGNNGAISASGTLSHFSDFVVRKVPRRAGLSVGFLGVPEKSKVGKTEIVEVSIFKPRSSEFAADPVDYDDNSAIFTMDINSETRTVRLDPLRLGETTQSDKDIPYSCKSVGNATFRGAVFFTPTTDSKKFFTVMNVSDGGLIEQKKAIYKITFTKDVVCLGDDSALATPTIGTDPTFDPTAEATSTPGFLPTIDATSTPDFIPTIDATNTPSSAPTAVATPTSISVSGCLGLLPGSYLGDRGCQIGNTTLSINGNTIILSPLGSNSNVEFNPSGNSATSVQSNLNLFGQAVHIGKMQNCSGSSFVFRGEVAGNPSINCTESFNQ